MIRLTPAAARQIRQAAGVGEGSPVSLRIAARERDDGTIEFGMGFDEARHGDLELDVDGITLLVAKPSQELVAETVVDFLEVAPGEARFVFARAEES